MKKKYGLFKVLSLLLLIVVGITYVVNGRDGNITYLALGDVLLNCLQSYYFFFDTALFIFVVGGFYGFLNKIPAYGEMLRGIVNKIGERKRLFVILVTMAMALVASLTGLNGILLLVVPMVVSIILLLGYDKLVALSATVGGIMVGLMGGVFVTVKDPNSYYGVSYATIDKLVGLESQFPLVTVIAKIGLLVLGTGLLVYTIISHIKKVEAKEIVYELDATDVFYLNDKVKGKKVKDEVKKDVRVWPLMVIFGLMFIILVLGYIPWADLFEIKIFNEFQNWLLELKIGDYSIFTSLVSSNLPASGVGAFGTWAGLGNYMMTILILMLVIIILWIVYWIKFDELLDGFMDGAKKMLPAVMIVMLAYTVLVCAYNHGFMETAISFVTDKFGDNAIMHGLVVLISSILYGDLYYTIVGIFTTITSNLDGANLNVYAVMFQSLYGMVQVFGPTSMLLIVGLTYLEVPYKTWLKYIWRFVVELLIVILVVVLIVSLV